MIFSHPIMGLEWEGTCRASLPKFPHGAQTPIGIRRLGLPSHQRTGGAQAGEMIAPGFTARRKCVPLFKRPVSRTAALQRAMWEVKWGREPKVRAFAPDAFARVAFGGGFLEVGNRALRGVPQGVEVLVAGQLLHAPEVRAAADELGRARAAESVQRGHACSFTHVSQRSIREVSMRSSFVVWVGLLESGR